MSEETKPVEDLAQLAADAKSLMEATADVGESQQQIQQTSRPKPTAEDIAEMKKLIAEHEGVKVEHPPLGQGEMYECDLYLKMDKNGSGVNKKGVTPAEAMLLVAMHHAAAGGNPIKTNEGVLNISNLRTVKRSAREEKHRLLGKYSDKKVNALFPGAMPQMPTDFDHAGEAGLESAMPNERLIDHDIATS